MGYNSAADITLTFIRNSEMDLTLQKVKVIQSHRSGVNRKLTCDFLLVTDSNFGHFRDIDS